MLTVIFVTAAISQPPYYSATNKASKAKPRLFKWSTAYWAYPCRVTHTGYRIPGIAYRAHPQASDLFISFFLTTGDYYDEDYWY